MAPIKQALATLVGREPTAEEIAKFYKIKDACGFSDHDAVWAMLLAFGHYEILYGEIPNHIANKTQELLAEHKLALDATASAAERHIKANFVDAVANTAHEIAERVISAANRVSSTAADRARDDARRKYLMAFTMSIGAAAITVGLVAWGAFHIGIRSGAADKAWVQTVDGQAARRFADMNQITAMLDCPAPYQRRQNGDTLHCIPYDTKAQKGYGWRIK